MKANIYPKEEFWCVDYIDINYDMLPTVGIFRELQDARQSALVWCNGIVEHITMLSTSTW